MRKIALLAAFVAAAAVGPATLHAQGTTPQPNHPMGRGARTPGGMDQMLLRGITLTDAEKAQLEQLRDADRAQMQNGGGRQQGRADFDAMRQARQTGDTATANRLMRDQRAKMEARRDAQTAAIRNILSDDQRTQFDANVAEMKKREGQGGRARGRRPPPVAGA